MSLHADGSGATSELVLSMTNGVAQEIYMVPMQASDAQDDIVLVAYQMLTVPVVFGGQETIKYEGKQAANAIDGGTLKIGSGNKPGTRENVIYADSTPAGMIDKKLYRIPPRKDTKIWVTKTQNLFDKVIYLRVLGNSDKNGYASMYDQNLKAYLFIVRLKEADFKAGGGDTYNGYLQGHVFPKGGVSQTMPGFSGNLTLALFASINEDDPDKAGVKTNGFSVAAIPNGVTMEFSKILQGDVRQKGVANYNIEWGAKYNYYLASDSGDASDLDKVSQKEIITQIKDKTIGYYADKKTTVGEWSPAYVALGIGVELADFNSLYQGSKINPNNTQKKIALATLLKLIQFGRSTIQEQKFVFFDKRTGMVTDDKNIPARDEIDVTASGFNISYSIDISSNPEIFKNGKTAAVVGRVSAGTIKDSEPIVKEISITYPKK